MQLNELRHFLLKFDINDDVIDRFLEGKSITVVDNNIFLSDKKFDDNVIYRDCLIFINLKDNILISKFLLDYIKSNSNNSIEINEKQALNFTYGKIPDINKSRLKNHRYYLILNEKEVMGYISYDGKNITNEMNIGQYLHEN